MHKYTSKAAAILASGSLFLYALVPAALADSAFTISGNGSYSTNDIAATSTETHNIVQGNTANVTNAITSTTNTGNNTADDNTGGNVAIGTGNAASTVDVTTRVNLNKAIDNSSFDNTLNSFLISGNGSSSTNDIAFTDTKTKEVFQDNTANITNAVTTDDNTGYNSADRNTGGDTTVVTGHSASDVVVRNQANANIANLGSYSPAAAAVTGSGLNDLRIVGNGSYSTNSIALSDNRLVNVVQSNEANITNAITTTGNTGNNTADDNTGGNVRVDTGNSQSAVGVDNMANFNVANADVLSADTLAKVSGNGSESDSTIASARYDTLGVFQGSGNLYNLTNAITTDPYTGVNNMSRNTGGILDPEVLVTGHAVSDTIVRNTGNANFFGVSGSGLSVGFDMHPVLGLLGL